MNIKEKIKTYTAYLKHLEIELSEGMIINDVNLYEALRWSIKQTRVQISVLQNNHRQHCKITEGFVIQVFEGPNCISQEFKACCEVRYEDMDGELVDIDVELENYQPFDMVQP